MKTHLSHSVFVMVYVTCIIANVNSASFCNRLAEVVGCMVRQVIQCTTTFARQTTTILIAEEDCRIALGPTIGGTDCL